MRETFSGVIDWLLEDQQEDLYYLVFAACFNLVFLVLAALLLWPLGHITLLLQIGGSYLQLWIATWIMVFVSALIFSIFRINIHQHSTIFIAWNLIANCLLQVGWSSRIVRLISDNMADQPLWFVVLLYILALLSFFTANQIVSAFYRGQLYTLIGLPLALIALAIFCIWPGLCWV